MKKFILFQIGLLVFPFFVYGQNFTFEAENLTVHGSPGKLLTLDAFIKNISKQELHLRIIRLENDLPPGWSTSLCNGALCYPPERNMYSVPDTTLAIPALGIDDSLEFHLNFNTGVTQGTVSIPIRVVNINDTTEAVELTFTASTLPTGVSERDVPKTFHLYQNYPNPFNPSTTITFEIDGDKPKKIQLTVYNLLGQEVVELLNRKLSPGNYEAQWDTRDLSGSLVPSGLYFYKIQVKGFSAIRKMMLIR